VEAVKPLVVSDVTVVTVNGVIVLVVREVDVIDVVVSVELMVVVSLATCAGDENELGFAKDGEVASRAIRNTSVKPKVTASIRCRYNRLFPFNYSQFLARLMIPTVARPIMIPARMDSHGKPGIPGTFSVLVLT